MTESKHIIRVSSDSPEVSYLTLNDPKLLHIISKIGTLTYTPYSNSFTFLVDTIIGQMLSNKVADILSARMVSLCKNNVCPHTVSKLSIPDLRNIGLSNAKSQYILNLASHFLDKPDYFENFPQLSDDEIINKIVTLRGLGIWSAKMYLIFVLNRPDILPLEDGAFRQAYSWLYSTTSLSNKAIEAQCAVWKPYSSIAARYLYRALDSGLTQTPIPS